MEKHLAPPYKINLDENFLEIVRANRDGVYRIAKIYVPRTTEGSRGARKIAAFIVRACNAHAALLEAARLVVVGGDQCFCHAGPKSWGRHRLGLGPGPCDYCVAKQAIALAESGKDGAE